MSFLKQLLTPFVEFDDQKKTDAVKTVKPQIRSSAPPTIASIPQEPAEHPLITGSDSTIPVPDATAQIPTFSQSGGMAAPLPEHEQYFEKLINEANITNPLFQGTDFKEFVDSKLDIDDITDETIRYKTAFNVLKSTGLTREKLFSTGQEYLNLIGRDLNAFQSAHSVQHKKEVQGKEVIIQKKVDELQILTQRMASLKSEINNLTQEIRLTKDKLDTTKKSFLLAGENKQKEIQTELEKIAQYF
jgi:hypothetical protein